jgi:hypothetical protein
VNAQEPFDTYYGRTTRIQELAALDNLAIFLRRNLDTVAYIAFHVGEKDKFKKVKKRAERAKKWLVSEREIDASRIIIVNGGKLTETTFILQPMDKDKPPPFRKSS